MRECIDSTEHPLTIPAVVAFDETGSMGAVPRQLQERLALLKGATLRAGLKDLQLCFGAYGDAQNDEVAPCQVGQFESGLEMEEWLNNLYLEGYGGGNMGETAGLLLYFLAHHSRLDSLDKRGKKGYLILTGDEVALPLVTKSEIERYIGDVVQSDLRIEDVVADVKAYYDVYMFLVDNPASKSQDSLRVWGRLLGPDHIVTVQSVDTISEQIAMLIGRLEGAFETLDDASRLLVAAGADPDAVKRAGRDLALVDKFVPTTAVGAAVTGTLPPADAVAGGITRL
jgi:hypothetical protein